MKSYIEPTQAAGRALMQRELRGPVVMLNLLRFRAVADYSAFPDIAPAAPISGAEAYERYMEHTMPFLQESGGEYCSSARAAHFSLVLKKNTGTASCLSVKPPLRNLSALRAIKTT
jgi:hypothetical protein